MKKIIAIALALCLMLGCTAALAEDKTYNVGILQLAPHPALDAATQGFKDTLTSKLGEGNVKYEELNASNDIPACATLANELVSSEVDLIMANATPAVQAAMNATPDIPVVGTAVTVYNFLEGATNVTGTSDLAPLDEQANMVLELFPEAKKVGILYCSSELNSVYQVQEITKYLKALNVEVKEYPFADSNDVASVAQLATEEVDVMYIPTDNTAASYTETIANVVIPAKLPVIAGESGICSGCGVATFSIDYYTLGCITAEMAYEVLVNGANPAEMEVRYAPEFTKMYNAANAAELGVTIPEGYAPIE
ncbi:MAG: ABC transporter substrate-binding protein [Clostridia bacterium]|nr:ABC transporter substrate-binding protein [Clostridia bacterium]